LQAGVIGWVMPHWLPQPSSPQALLVQSPTQAVQVPLLLQV
jgi:hypothetical protein